MEKKHLTKRGSIWHFNYKIPIKYQPYMTGKYADKKVIQKSLKTDSLKAARQMRDALLLELKGIEAQIDLNPDKTRLTNLINEIRAKYQLLEEQQQELSREEAHELEQTFFEVYDAQYESEFNKDDVKAAAILLATSRKRTSALGYDIRITLADAGAQYLSHVDGHIGETTVRRTKKSLAYFSDFKSGEDAYLTTIKRPTVVEFIHFLERQNISSSTISNHLSCLSQVWGYARDRDTLEVLGDSPFKNHRLKPVISPTDARRPFTTREFEILQLALFAKSKGNYGRQWIAPIALVSGLRLNELCGLKTIDIKQDSKNNRWYFDINDRSRSLKTSAAARKVPIHNSVLKAVLKLKETSSNEFLFEEVIRQRPTNRGGTIGTWFSRTKNLTFPNYPELVFHCLRRHLPTALDDFGVDVGLVQSLMGHKRNSLALDTYSSGKRFDTLCNAFDKANDAFLPFVEHFPTE